MAYYTSVRPPEGGSPEAGLGLPRWGLARMGWL